MKVFVTGVGGQLGHDVMNELARRGYEGIGSDIHPVYSGIQDGSAVTAMPYRGLDITDKDAVFAVIEEIRPNVIVHCAAWTNVDGAEDPEAAGGYGRTGRGNGILHRRGTGRRPALSVAV